MLASPKAEQFRREEHRFDLADALRAFMRDFGGAGGMGGGPANVGVVIARVEPVSLTTELSGRTSAVLVSEVRPQVSGIIKARLFQEGGTVRAGQPLYQIDPASYQAAYNSAAAGLAQAQAAYTAARLKADRYKTLVESGAVSRQDNDDAQATGQQAAANVAAQKAAVDAARAVRHQHLVALAAVCLCRPGG